MVTQKQVGAQWEEVRTEEGSYWVKRGTKGKIIAAVGPHPAYGKPSELPEEEVKKLPEAQRIPTEKKIEERKKLEKEFAEAPGVPVSPGIVFKLGLISEKEMEKAREEQRIFKATPETAHAVVELKKRYAGLYERAVDVEARPYVPEVHVWVRQFQKEQREYYRKLREQREIEKIAETPQAIIGHALSLEKWGGLLTAGEMIETGIYQRLGKKKAWEELAEYWKQQRIARTWRFAKTPEEELKKELTGIGAFAGVSLIGGKVFGAIPVTGKLSLLRPAIGTGIAGAGLLQALPEIERAKRMEPGAGVRLAVGGTMIGAGITYAATPGFYWLKGKIRQWKTGLAPGERIEQLKFQKSLSEIRSFSEQFKTQFRGVTVGKEALTKFKGKTVAAEYGKFKTAEFFTGITRRGEPIFGDVYAFTTKVGRRYYTYGFGDVYKIMSRWERASARFLGGYGLAGVREVEAVRTPTAFWAKSWMVREPEVIKTWELPKEIKVLTKSYFKTTGVSVTPKGFVGFRDIAKQLDISKAIVSGGVTGLGYRPTVRPFPSLGGEISFEFHPFKKLGQYIGAGFGSVFPPMRRKKGEEALYVSPFVQKQIEEQLRGLTQGLFISQKQIQITRQVQLQKLTQGLKQGLRQTQTTGLAQTQLQTQFQQQLQQQIQQQLQLQKQIQIQIQTPITLMPPVIPPTQMPPIKPPPTRIFPFPTFLFPSVRRRRKKRKRKVIRRRYRYKPSLIGATFRIPQPRIPRELTGLGVRGIPFIKRRKRKRKRKRKKRKSKR